MVYQYIVTLRRNNDRYIDMMNILLCLLSAAAFIFKQLAAGRFDVLFSLVSLLLIAGIVVNMVKARGSQPSPRYKYLLFLSGTCWIFMPYLQWVSLLFFLLSLLEYQAKHPLEVGFSQEQVVINTLFKRTYGWKDFNNVILKDGLLTLDFRNNTLFQKEALDDPEGEADEDEFNEFCRKQLHASQLPASGLGSP